MTIPYDRWRGGAAVQVIRLLTRQTLEIGLEATGHYWLAVYSFLADWQFKLHVLNPIQTDGWRKGVEIRRHKTDVIDSMLIAELVRYGDFMEARLPDEAVLSLKHLTRFHSYLVDSIGDLKRKVCVGAVARKLCHIIFAVLSENRSFEIRGI